MQLFGVEYANVQPHSGAQANAAVLMALLEPGDCVLGMGLDQGATNTWSKSKLFRKAIPIYCVWS